MKTTKPLLTDSYFMVIACTLDKGDSMIIDVSKISKLSEKRVFNIFASGRVNAYREDMSLLGIRNAGECSDDMPEAQDLPEDFFIYSEAEENTKYYCINSRTNSPVKRKKVTTSEGTVDVIEELLLYVYSGQIEFSGEVISNDSFVRIHPGQNFKILGPSICYIITQ